jgi:ATP-dependent Clp protease protease subunit
MCVFVNCPVIVSGQWKKDHLCVCGLCRDSIRSAKKGSPTITPAVLTPSGPADLQTLLLRNRIVFVGSPVNSQVCTHPQFISVIAW